MYVANFGYQSLRFLQYDIILEIAQIRVNRFEQNAAQTAVFTKLYPIAR